MNPTWAVDAPAAASAAPGPRPDGPSFRNFDQALSAFLHQRPHDSNAGRSDCSPVRRRRAQEVRTAQARVSEGGKTREPVREVVERISLPRRCSASRTRALISITHRVGYLTDTQERILRLIREHIATHGEAPTITQIRAAAGLRSRASVHYQLGELETKHAIVREPGQRRGIRLA
jgi:repressor LexA